MWCPGRCTCNSKGLTSPPPPLPFWPLRKGFFLLLSENEGLWKRKRYSKRERLGCFGIFPGLVQRERERIFESRVGCVGLFCVLEEYWDWRGCVRGGGKSGVFPIRSLMRLGVDPGRAWLRWVVGCTVHVCMWVHISPVAGRKSPTDITSWIFNP